MQISRAPRHFHNEELHMNGSTTSTGGQVGRRKVHRTNQVIPELPREPHLAFSLSGSSSRHQPTCNAITFPIFHRCLSLFNILDKEDKLHGERSPTPSNSPPDLAEYGILFF